LQRSNVVADASAFSPLRAEAPAFLLVKLTAFFVASLKAVLKAGVMPALCCVALSWL